MIETVIDLELASTDFENAVRLRDFVFGADFRTGTGVFGRVFQREQRGLQHHRRRRRPYQHVAL